MAFLCEDGWFNILSRLPAKSICMLKSTCESFLDFSKEAYFCMKQTQNIRYDSCFFLQHTTQMSSANRVELHPLIKEESLSCGVPKHFLNYLAKSTKIIASNSGLVLCQSKREGGKIFICNLVTQTWLPIATLDNFLEYPNFDIDIVFKCNNETNLDIDDYKLILIEKPHEWTNYCNLKVYLPKEGVWEAIEKPFFIGGRNMRLEMPVYLQNILYIVSDSHSPYFGKSSLFYDPYIMTYNFETGESTMLKLPKDARKPSDDMGIFEWKRVEHLDHSICLVKHMELVFTIWSLVDYKSNLWRRVLKKGVKGMGLKEKNPKIQGFTVMNGDSLVFATEKKVYGYDLKGENYMRLREICEHNWDTKVRFTSYSNTLRPCGSGSTYFPREDK